ncbi:hypothetical protein OOK41_13015 [Micromonospora sp. NBC_01655]|uniref:hypothetical protein n=1 Tax=Micromonospora sp. NBC_01655 TaxID=2975983 RepID=UPI0022555A9F|nr:hypothetical protein [Micromonospora sp. NBC_01655]MCX4471223.1 hypothetical protein [Micromonospora sp. NBC_01655]
MDALRRTAALALPPEQMPPGLQVAGWTPPVAVELSALLVTSLLALVVAARRFARTG